MFRSLFRRSTETPAKKITPPPAVRPTGIPKLPIVVPQSAMDAFPADPNPLVGAVVDYVNALINQGRYIRGEVPAAAMQAYHTDFYLAQVLNGGHSQFIHNAMSTLANTLEDVTHAFDGLDAPEYQKIFVAMVDWAKANPQEAGAQTGFNGGRAAPLEDLDTAFYGLENGSEPLRMRIAKWLAKAPDLSVVPDGALQETIGRIVEANPKRAYRSHILRLSHFEGELTNTTRVGISAACGRAQPLGALFALGGGSYMEVEGEEKMTFLIKTTAGNRWATMGDTEISIYERIDHDNSHMPKDPLKATMDDINKWKKPEVGARLATVTSDEAEAIVAISKQLKAAAAIELLAASAPMPVTLDSVTIRSAGPGPTDVLGMSLLLVANQASVAFSAIVEEAGATLLTEPGHERVATVSRQEIDAYAAEFALTNFEKV